MKRNIRHGRERRDIALIALINMNDHTGKNLVNGHSPSVADSGAGSAFLSSSERPSSSRRATDTPASLRTASVIVNTYNRASYLRNCIRSIAYQSYPRVELIVVNGPSTDDTESVLEGIKSRGLAFKIARCANRNLSESRNIGIAEAAGDVVFFIDDDAVAHPEWVARLMSTYDHPAVGAAGGFTIDHTGVTFQCRYTVCNRHGNARFFQLIDPTAILEGLRNFSYPSLLGTNCSFRRKDLLAINGFDEAYAYFLDETDVCLRLFERNLRIVSVPNAFVFHKYAASELRTVEKIPNSLRAPAKSKAHFVIKHAAGQSPELGPALTTGGEMGELEHYTNELQFSNRWHLDHKKISAEHYLRLDNDLRLGIAEGIRSGMDCVQEAHGDCELAKTKSLDNRRAFLPLGDEKRASEIRNRLKIYFVSQGYPPKDTAGIARWTHECARALTARGHEVHVLTRGTTTTNVDYVDGVWIHAVADSIPEEQLLPSPIDIPDSVACRAAAVFAEVERAEKIWGVTLVSAPIWDLEGLYCAKYLSKPVITSLHTTYLLALPSKPDWLDRPTYRQNHVAKVIEGERWLLNHSNRILANSREVLREIDTAYQLDLDHDKSRVRVVPHGIADSHIDLEPVQEPLARENVISVLFVGRVETRKGLDQLLRALLRLPRTGFKVNVNVVGSWPTEHDSYAQKIKALARELAAKRNGVTVNFAGYASDEVLLEYYAGADIFVAPSRFESFGLILIEAMRGGCPVIATNIGGMREIVDENTGFLIDVDDHEALAMRLENLITNSVLRKEMGRAGRRKFEAEYTADKMALSLESYYRELLQEVNS